MRPPLMPLRPPLAPSLPSLGRQRKETGKIKGKYLNVKARVSICCSWRAKHLPMKSHAERLPAPVGHLWWGAEMTSSGVLSLSNTSLCLVLLSCLRSYFFIFVFLFSFLSVHEGMWECAPPPAMAALLTGFGLVSLISISLFVSLASRLTSDDQTHASEKGKPLSCHSGVTPSPRTLSDCGNQLLDNYNLSHSLLIPHTPTGRMGSIYDSVEVDYRYSANA